MMNEKQKRCTWFPGWAGLFKTRHAKFPPAYASGAIGGNDFVDIATDSKNDIDSGCPEQSEKTFTYGSANDGVDCEVLQLAGAFKKGGLVHGDANGIILAVILEQK